MTRCIRYVRVLAIILIKVIILILLQFRAKQQMTIVYPDICVILQEGVNLNYSNPLSITVIFIYHNALVVN